MDQNILQFQNKTGGAYERAFSKNDEKATVILSVASFEYSIGS